MILICSTKNPFPENYERKFQLQIYSPVFVFIGKFSFLDTILPKTCWNYIMMKTPAEPNTDIFVLIYLDQL